MRVGLVCPYSFDVHGGVQNHVLDLARGLVTLGHDVSVLAPGENLSGSPGYVTTTGRTVAVPYNGSVARVSFGPQVAGRVRRWLDDGRFDVVHIHEPATPSVSVLALWATTAPVVATFHTAQARSWALETTAATFLRPGLAKIAAHIAVSEEARRTMSRYLAVEPALIPNGVQVDRFRRRTAVRGGVGRDERLAFVGRIDEPRKGLPVLLSALPAILQRRPTARLTVVGSGAPPAVLRRLPPAVADRVHFTGALDDDAKARVLAEADVLVAPNTHGESFGVVLLEAMAAGATVVASDLPAFRSVLRGGSCGALFRTGDPRALADVVVAQLEDEVARRRFAERAAGVVHAHDWAVLAPRVADVYAGVRRATAGAAAG